MKPGDQVRASPMYNDDQGATIITCYPIPRVADWRRHDGLASKLAPGREMRMRRSEIALVIAVASVAGFEPECDAYVLFPRAVLGWVPSSWLRGLE